MHYLIYGKNTYAVRQKADAVKEKFLATPNSEYNFSEFAGATFSYERFSAEAFATPFLARKRLIFVRNFLLESKDDEAKKKLVENLKKVPDTSVIFFLEAGEPDKRSALFKYLNKPKVAQLLSQPEPDQYARWIENFCRHQGYTISAEARRQLILSIGIDQWRAENELSKLFLFCDSKNRQEITLADVALLVTQDIGSDIFAFVEALAAKKEDKSFEYLTQLIDSGQNELYILTMMVYQFRNLLIVGELSGRGLGNAEIASKARIHPFVVSKLRSGLGRNFNQKLLEKALISLQRTDYEIKSGESDPRIALSLIVASICR